MYPDPREPGDILEVGDGFEVESNEILKPVCLGICSQGIACRFPGQGIFRAKKLSARSLQ